MGEFKRKGVIHYSAPHHDAIYDETQRFIKGFARKANISTEVASKVTRSITKDLTQVLDHNLSLKFRQLLPEGLKKECETLELASHKDLHLNRIYNHIQNYNKSPRAPSTLIKQFWAHLTGWNIKDNYNEANQLIDKFPKELKRLFDQ
ncbi:MAG: hypothetical protein KC478_12405 [Bacteriovoracaceae bacterium]|nr:hypothetical protein [Bacteriovoracaceae bacterium]